MNSTQRQLAHRLLDLCIDSGTDLNFNYAGNVKSLEVRETGVQRQSMDDYILHEYTSGGLLRDDLTDKLNAAVDVLEQLAGTGIGESK